jgi:hypothetical protein
MASLGWKGLTILIGLNNDKNSQMMRKLSIKQTMRNEKQDIQNVN